MKHDTELQPESAPEAARAVSPTLEEVAYVRAALEHLRIRTEAVLARKDGELRRLRAEVECLQIIKQRFEAVVDNVPSWLFACGSNGAVTYMNNSFARFTGHPVEEALGNGWLRFVHPDDVDAVRAALGQALATGISRGVSMRIRSEDGSYGLFHASGSAVRDGHGKLIEWYGMLIPDTNPHARIESWE